MTQNFYTYYPHEPHHPMHMAMLAASANYSVNPADVSDQVFDIHGNSIIHAAE